MTLNEIKAAVAAYVGKETSDLTVNGVDLGLSALNHVRQMAELQHDFGFSRKLLTLDVSGATGGSLEDAVIYGTDEVAAVKTLVDVGLFDAEGNFDPVEWTTTEESLSRQRLDNPGAVVRYPTDAQATTGPLGQRRFTFVGDNVYFFPKPTESVTFSLGLIAYTFTTDWVDADLLETSSVGAPWTTRGSQYLLWQSVIHLNKLAKEFVFRQEGNLAEPKDLADAGLTALIQWDIFKYEQFRRHGR